MLEIISSGTTGTPKKIVRSDKNIKACIDVALKAQRIDKNSRVLTVTRQTHAGGTLLQTIPAQSIGAYVKIRSFDPFTFLKEFEDYTHTFLPPAMCESLMKTKTFDDYDFKGKIVCMGSDPIPKDHIDAFTSRGAYVLANWGMTEIGPTTINKMYGPGEEGHNNILGDTFWTECEIREGVLWVKGPLCIYDDWFCTKDKVRMESGMMFYEGRIE